MNEQQKKIKDSNNMRMTEINTYYGELYKAYIDVLKIIVFFSLAFLALTIIKNMEVIPEIILNTAMGLVILAGLFYTLWLSYDISKRDNMNFSEYNWGFSKPKASDVSYDKSKDTKDDKSLSERLGLGCIGMECCSEGMTYNEGISKCVPIAASTVDPCNGLNDNSLASTIPVSCLQKTWKDAGCSSLGTVYPKDESAARWWLDNKGAGTYGVVKSNMKLWATMTDQNHVVGCHGSAAAPNKNSMWKCGVSGFQTPLRVNASNDVECMSTNNRDCLWKGSAAECEAQIQNPASPMKPLVCGEMHKKEWGGPGYDNPAHWCAKAASVFGITKKENFENYGKVDHDNELLYSNDDGQNNDYNYLYKQGNGVVVPHNM
jgi:hypothetical protein